jgi:hypothetical protein
MPLLRIDDNFIFVDLLVYPAILLQDVIHKSAWNLAVLTFTAFLVHPLTFG